MTKSKSTSNSILVVGLGNPGEEYENTPHNAGFLTVDALVEGFRVQDLGIIEKEDLKSELFEIKLRNKKLILAKPQTFMNKSGDAVKLLIQNYKISKPSTINPTPSLWVIHDDVDLELGKIKIVRNRGSAGHKGVEDIMRKVKTKDFVRFRIGIRPKKSPKRRPKSFMNKFVASQVTGANQALFKKSIKRATEAVAMGLEESIEKSMSIYNR